MIHTSAIDEEFSWTLENSSLLSTRMNSRLPNQFQPSLIFFFFLIGSGYYTKSLSAPTNSSRYAKEMATSTKVTMIGG